MNAALLIWLLILLLCEVTTSVTRQYFLLKNPATWENAQQYCRSNFKDLATVTTVEEDKRTLRYDVGFTWIGLKRSVSNSDTWQWSDGEPLTYFKWTPAGLSTTAGMDCVTLNATGWNSDSCLREYPFICYRGLILVKEPMSWDDALKYCRTHYTDLSHAYSLTSPSALDQEAAQTQTLAVWTGLRFLDGKWFWVNKEPLVSMELLPSCPAYNRRCGARNPDRHVWENRDCNDKLHFVCY